MKIIRATGRTAARVLPFLSIAIGLSGCAQRREPQQYFSSNFIPAGMSRVGPGGVRMANSGGYGMSRDPRGMAAGDPSVSAAVKAHVIRGLPGGPQNPHLGGGQPHP